MPKVMKEKCPQNHRCPAIRVYLVGAIEQVNFELPSINYEKCIECNKCVDFCPKGALEK